MPFPSYIWNISYIFKKLNSNRADQKQSKEGHTEVPIILTFEVQSWIN